MDKQVMALTGRNVVVTGAAQGIGRATVEWVVELGGSTGSVADPAFAPRLGEGVERFGAIRSCT
jgi:NAD(P)-dependent dehydrogenase (short-subunit alcohol dehydrogenase family)